MKLYQFLDDCALADGGVNLLLRRDMAKSVTAPTCQKREMSGVVPLGNVRPKRKPSPSNRGRLFADLTKGAADGPTAQEMVRAVPHVFGGFGIAEVHDVAISGTAPGSFRGRRLGRPPTKPGLKPTSARRTGT
jgi:hypothetical protein